METTIALLLAAKPGESFRVLLTLFVMLIAAKVMAEIFERLGQPAVVGEIMAGIMIGPSVLGLVAPSEFTSLLAEIGIIFLLFTVGLETKPSAIFSVGGRALAVAVLGVILPFVAGWGLMRVLGYANVESMFVGTALVATSVGITARVLSGMKLLDAPTARIILGAAIIDDILGLLLLAVVSNAAQGSIDYVNIAATAVVASAFSLFIALVGSRVITRLAPRIERLRIGESLYVVGL